MPSILLPDTSITQQTDLCMVDALVLKDIVLVAVLKQRDPIRQRYFIYIYYLFIYLMIYRRVWPHRIGD
jgi:hypothetical protein